LVSRLKQPKVCYLELGAHLLQNIKIMSDQTYLSLQKKLNEVYVISPNKFSNTILDGVFRTITSRLKYLPFQIYIPVAILLVVSLYLSIGYLVVRLASILQYGF